MIESASILHDMRIERFLQLHSISVFCLEQERHANIFPNTIHTYYLLSKEYEWYFLIADPIVRKIVFCTLLVLCNTLSALSNERFILLLQTTFTAQIRLQKLEQQSIQKPVLMGGF